MKVALIVGHKETSQGAVNKELGVTEFKFNEPLAHSIAEKLLLEGFEPIIIYRDTYASLPAKVNATGADIAISLHCNAFNGKPNGTEVLHYVKSKKSKKLASILLAEIFKCLGLRNRGLRPVNYDYIGSKGDRGGLLCKETSMPCVIAEPFFIDSKSSLLLAQEKLEELSESYVSAVKKYFNGE